MRRQTAWRDIERYLCDEPVEACPPSTRYRLSKFLRKHRTEALTAAALAALLITGVVGTAIGLVRALHAESRARRSEANAKTEASVAQAVNEFLQQDLLAQASAFNQVGRDIHPDPNLKVRTALDRAAQRIGDRFTRQPLVEAAIRVTIGEAYQGLGEYPTAQKHLEQARWLYKETLGEDHEKTLAVSSRLGELLQRQGKAKEAEDLLQRTLEGQRRSTSAAKLEVAATLVRLGQTSLDLDHRTQAENSASEGLALYQKILGDDDPGTVHALSVLASIQLELDHFAQAEALHRKVVRICEKAFGEANPITAKANFELGIFHKVKGLNRDADRLMCRAQQVLADTLGSDHPETLIAQMKIGGLRDIQGRFEESEKLSREAYEGLRRVLGAEHPETLFAWINQAATMMNWGRTQEALRLLEAIVETQTRVQGPEHSQTLYVRNILANAYRESAQPEKALSLYQQTHELQLRVLGPDHRDTLSTLGNLANAHAELRQFEKAMSETMEVVERLTKVLGKDHHITWSRIGNLGTIELELGRAENRRDLLERGIKRIENAFESLRTILGPDNPDTLHLQANFAGGLLILGRFSQAEVIQASLLEKYRGIYGPVNNRTLLQLNNLAATYKKQSRFAEAERLVRGAQQALAASQDKPHPNLYSYFVNFGEIFMDQKKSKEVVALLIPTIARGERDFDPMDRNLADLRFLLGKAFLDQINYRDAEPCFRKAYEVYKVVRTQTDLQRGLCLFDLALSCSMNKRYEDADKFYNDYLKFLKGTTIPEKDHLILKSLSAMSLMYGQQGRSDKVIECLEEKIELSKRKYGEAQLERLQDMDRLAGWYRAEAKPDEVTRVKKELADVYRRNFKVDDERTLTALRDLAQWYEVTKHPEEAEQYLLDLYQTCKKSWGKDHRYTQMSQLELGQNLCNQGRFAEAEPLLRDALAAIERVEKGDRIEPNGPRFILARSLFGQAKYQEALPYFQEVARREQEMLPKLGPGVKSNLRPALDYLAHTYQALDRNEEAEQCLKQLQDIVNKDESLEKAGALANQGHSLIQEKKYLEAESILRESLELRMKHQADHWSRYNVESLIGECLLGQGKLADAEPLLISGYKGMMQHEEDCHKLRLPEAAQRLVNLYELLGQNSKAEEWTVALEEHRSLLKAKNLEEAAALNLKQEEFAEAEPLLRTSRDLWRRYRPGKWQGFAVQSRLAEALIGMRRFADAEALLLESFRELEAQADKLSQFARLQIDATEKRLVKLYDAWGKKTEADKWRGDLEKAAGEPSK